MTSADGTASACLTALFRGDFTLVRVGPSAAVPFASIAFGTAGAAVAATFAGLFFATFFVLADFFAAGFSAAGFSAAERDFNVAVDSAVAPDATFAAAFLRGARALGAGFAAGAAPSAVCVSPSLDDARRFRGAASDTAPDPTPDAASSALAEVFTEDRRWRTGLSADPAVVSLSLIAFGC